MVIEGFTNGTSPRDFQLCVDAPRLYHCGPERECQPRRNATKECCRRNACVCGAIRLEYPPRVGAPTPVPRVKACPVCKTIRPSYETICECGHDFAQQAAQAANVGVAQLTSSFAAPETVFRRRVLPAVKFLSALTVFLAALVAIVFLLVYIITHWGRSDKL
jgi:hypothetical protein